jgi:hypothetical protein
MGPNRGPTEALAYVRVRWFGRQARPQKFTSRTSAVVRCPRPFFVVGPTVQSANPRTGACTEHECCCALSPSILWRRSGGLVKQDRAQEFIPSTERSRALLLIYNPLNIILMSFLVTYTRTNEASFTRYRCYNNTKYYPRSSFSICRIVFVFLLPVLLALLES